MIWLSIMVSNLWHQFAPSSTVTPPNWTSLTLPPTWASKNVLCLKYLKTKKQKDVFFYEPYLSPPQRQNHEPLRLSASWRLWPQPYLQNSIKIVVQANSHYMDCSKWTTPAPSTNTSAFTISTLCVSEEYFLGPYFLGTVCVLAICLPSVLIDQRRFKWEILWNFLAWRISTRRSKKGRYIKSWKTDAVGIAAQKVQSNKTSS